LAKLDICQAQLFTISDWFSLDYKGIQPGMAAQPMRTR